MDDKRPYEQNDLPFGNLPDVDGAWADMKARLDSEDRRRRFILPPFFTGCGGWALLLLLLAGGGLWWYWSTGTGNESLTAAQDNKMDSVPVAQKNKQEKGSKYIEDVPGREQSAAAAQPLTKGKQNISTVATKTTALNNPQQKKSIQKKSTGNKRIATAKPGDAIAQKGTKGKANIFPQTENGKETKVTAQQTEKEQETGVTTQAEAPITTDTTAKRTDTTGSKSAPDSVALPPIKPKTENKRLQFAAGLTLQQQLPLAGQQWTPYNYRGRKGSLGDYVPAADLRLYKEDKWFIQAGFRYGAPQYTREFVYSKAYKTDTFGVVQSSTAYKLKKTYYHQVPVSFHYFVKKNWSVGAGLVYNRFFAAVSEREDREQLTPTTDSLVGKAIVRDRGDSLFRSSNLQLLLETQYQWRRFSIGARFAQGLQPYINYTDAQGNPRKQRSSSVNLFIRYELWRQKN